MLNNNIFSQFSKNQKSALCHSLKIFVKNNPDLSVDLLLSNFLDNENYYIEMNSSRLSFIKDFLNDSNFIKELKFYLVRCSKYYEHQKSLEPLKQAMKEKEREKRKFLKELKMSKEAPTKRQIYYYKSLCKKLSIEAKNTDDLSKLDLRNLIKEMTDEN